VILLLLCVLSAGPAWSGPEAIILYTANSQGKYEPCESCDDGEPVGGLARRAHVFSKFRNEVPESRMFAFGGGNEFLPILPMDEPSSRETKFTAKAYELLEYDLGCLRPDEAERLEDAGAGNLSAWSPFGREHRTRVIEKGEARIGVVVFPDSGELMPEIDGETMRSVAESAADLRGEVDLVVALSAWGEPVERSFIEAHPGAVDVLLGGGFGAGSGLRAPDNADTLWIRPEMNGWGVQVLKVLKFPKNEDEQWREGDNFDFDTIRLDDTVDEDERIAALLQWL
jgi:2',3'-cyclic-nucleotide 2'-phosphodiesterase (5'-nucleotidase family)